MEGVTTAASRWLDLEGTANSRDLGGLPLEGGGATAAGVLLRSDNLQDLSPAAVRRLVDDLGVAVVVDLRTGVEVELEGPGPLVEDGRVEIRHRDLYAEVGQMTDAGAFPWIAARGRTGEEAPAVAAYLGYLRDRPDSILAALRDIAHAPGAVLVHCAAGKDRTGVSVALVLRLLGVPHDDVVGDYLLTEHARAAIDARLHRDVEPLYPVSYYLVVPEAIEAVLQVWDEHPGGVEGWFVDAGGDAEVLERLRDRMLA